MQPKAILIVLLVVINTVTYGQNNELLYRQALQFKKENSIDEALRCFKLLLKSDSTRIDYLTNGSIIYSKKGNEFIDEKNREVYFKQAFELAKKSLKISSDNAESHYCMALVLGRMNEFAALKTKIANAKQIKYHADETLRLNPAHAGAYHILGRWNRTIAGFGSVEKLMINNLYGGVPEGASYESAVNAFVKAIAFEPIYKLHQFELAQTYLEMGKPLNARIWFQKALELKSNSLSDKKIDDSILKILAKSDK